MLTLSTLAQHNDLSQFILLHGDDCSEDRTGPLAAEALGFKTVVQSSGERQGVARMTEALFKEAKIAGAEAVLNLQNDWKSLRTIPVVELEDILRDPAVYCVRMYGFWKSESGRCGQHHAGRTPRELVEWKPYRINGYEVGDIHWGHPPAVTRITEACALTKGAEAESVSRWRSGKLKKLTVRPLNNFVNHIGRERTPRFHS